MTAEGLVDSLVAALGLPASCRVDQRVPKKMLIDHGAPTAADKRLLNDCIESVQWLAVLKPHTVGVPIWRDDEREYLEIAVLVVTLRHESTLPTSPASVARLTELLTSEEIPLSLSSGQAFGQVEGDGTLWRLLASADEALLLNRARDRHTHRRSAHPATYLPRPAPSRRVGTKPWRAAFEMACTGTTTASRPSCSSASCGRSCSHTHFSMSRLSRGRWVAFGGT